MLIYMKFDSFVIVKGMFFGEEGGSEGRFTVIIKFFVSEAGQDGCFTYSSISNCDQFDLNNIALLIFYS